MISLVRNDVFKKVLLSACSHPGKGQAPQYPQGNLH